MFQQPCIKLATRLLRTCYNLAKPVDLQRSLARHKYVGTYHATILLLSISQL